MDFYTFLSKEGFNILIILIFAGTRLYNWAIRLYNCWKDSDHTMSHKEKDYDKEEEDDDYEEDYEEEVKKEVDHQAISATVGKPVKKAQSIPQEAAANPSLSKTTSSVDRKAHVIGKRKLFKNGLLIHALIKRKDYIV